MSPRGGRWVFVTWSLSNRSKGKREQSSSFKRWLIDSGYRPLNPGAYLRYVPTRKRAQAEMSSLLSRFPELGILHVVEVSSASLRRAIIVESGNLVETPMPPELLTVY